MQQTIKIIQQFLQSTFSSSGKKRGVIAVSGGIDSAVSCTLLAQVLGAEHVYPIFLPYGEQSTVDSRSLVKWCGIPEKNWHDIQIAHVVQMLAQGQGIDQDTMRGQVRLGNIMARVRMIFVFDLAQELDALACGTENKSEKYLGYFTRFGDGASDIEPIQHLYKTEVKKMAEELGIPNLILQKPPSAGLWHGQTDETELGFSYQDADRVLTVIVDQKPEILAELVRSESNLEQLSQAVVVMLAKSIDYEIVMRVLERVKGLWFKQVVPYHLIDQTQGQFPK